MWIRRMAVDIRCFRPRAWFFYALLTLSGNGFINLALKIFADKDRKPYINLTSIYLVSGSLMWLVLIFRHEMVFNQQLLLLGLPAEW
jgi:hypothetical protein